MLVFGMVNFGILVFNGVDDVVVIIKDVNGNIVCLVDLG